MDQKISALTAYRTPLSADLLVIVNTAGGITDKITIADFLNVRSDIFTIKDATDNTKQVAFNVTAIPTSSEIILTIPGASDTLVLLTQAQTITNKTIGSGTKITLGSENPGALYYRDGSGNLTALNGTNGQIVSWNSSNIPTAIPNPAASNGSTTVKGIFQESTQAQTDAQTQAGSTGADLALNPSTLRSFNINSGVIDTGSSTAYAIAPSPAITAYAAYQQFTFKAANTNTSGTPTLNVSTIGAKTMVMPDGGAIAIGAIVAGAIITVEYDGTNMQIISGSSRVFVNGVTTYDLTTTSGVQNIAHGLGKIPKYVRISGIIQGGNSGNGIPVMSQTIYNGTNQSSYSYGFSGTQGSIGNTFLFNTGSGQTQTGVVTFDATNIIITWTKGGSPTGSINILWEAQG